jgi:hypothetical protein
LSSAILYLAIVAIWAGFLVPAWIRRPHGSRSASVADFDVEVDVEVEASSPDPPAADGTLISAEAGRARLAGGYDDPGTDGYGHDGYGDDGYGDDAYGHEPTGPGRSELSGQGHGTEHQEAAPGPRQEDALPAGRTTAARASQSHEQMLRARRRALAFLAGLTMLPAGPAAIGLASWWLCVPPAGMLVLYVLLLREIATADAEMASKRRRAELAMAESQRSDEIRSASQQEPTAQIIDISSRVGDQLYDQYADAAVRAVGD